MYIGNFQQNGDQYEGSIVSLGFTLDKVTIRPCDKAQDKEPDYRVYVETKHGEIEIGAAWERTNERGEFLSLSLDGFMLPAPVNLALFFGEGDEPARLSWNRQKAKPAKQQAAIPKGKKAKAA